MIPKIIHLCWFSGDKYPEDIQFCINSWKKVLPDFQIKVWTKEMALATGIDWAREAISVKKWAFAADVIRLYAVYHDGGVYMDSDIYVQKRFDEFMEKGVHFFKNITQQWILHNMLMKMVIEEVVCHLLEDAWAFRLRCSCLNLVMFGLKSF